MQTAFDIATYTSAAIVAYYLLLFAVSLWSTRQTSGGDAGPLTFVVVVPAHNEELVIGQTVERLRALEDERFIALVMDDGSTDKTAAVARKAADGDPRITVITRPPEIAGTGKGDVLNDAYRIVSGMVQSGDARLRGADDDHVVICVLDADGWLEPHSLKVVAPYYGDERVAGVQLPVRMWNGRDGFLALMQDLEFIGFCLFVQAGRDPFGSVGLGGNGQFIRLSALQTLGAEPWTDCLTEDLDVGLSLVENGWRNRFCPRAKVSQQALNDIRPFMRQRTRWIQGHYSCWQHLPAIWREKGIPLVTRLDLSLYLLLVAFVLVLAAQFTIGMLSIFGFVSVETTLLSFVDDPQLHRALTLGLSCGPLIAFGVTYQRYSAQPLPWFALPGIFFVFAFYGFFWGIPASVRALGRMALGRGSWTKTPRTAVTAELLALEGMPAAVTAAGPGMSTKTVRSTRSARPHSTESPERKSQVRRVPRIPRPLTADVFEERLREALERMAQAEQRTEQAMDRIHSAKVRGTGAPEPA